MLVFFSFFLNVFVLFLFLVIFLSLVFLSFFVCFVFLFFVCFGNACDFVAVVSICCMCLHFFVNCRV